MFHVLSSTCVHGEEGQRAVITIESSSASHVWSIPGPHTT
jgi:hypothetical protein